MPKTSKKDQRSKHWIITINHPNKQVDSWWNPAQFSYLILGFEIGKKNTPHLQGYVVFKKKQRLSKVKKFFPRAHLEIKRGTPLEASVYCKKDGKFAEFGVLPKTAAAVSSVRMKKKWELIRKYAKTGEFDKIPASEYVRYIHCIKRIHLDNPKKPKRLIKSQNYWVHGKSGVGKSYFARDKWPDYYVKNKTKWFDGYRGEATVLIDDLDLSHNWMGSYLKNWADIYAFRGEQKGGGLMLRPKHIVVTSQFSIKQFCAVGNSKHYIAVTSNVSSQPLNGSQELFDALDRRFVSINLKPYSERLNPFERVQRDVAASLAAMSD